MNIKKIANDTLQFITHRIIEIIGISISLIGILLFLALISYSPNDPNFIFPDNTEIQNLLGFQGSYISDLFFQSIGTISYLITITLLITGINIFKHKDVFLFIENIFFSVFYCIVGSLFFDFFYQDTFKLYINGNGGFIGQYLSQTFLLNIINLQTTVSYFFLLILILAFFLISINFSPKGFWNFIKKIINFVNKDKSKPYTDKSEVISEYIPQEEIKNLIQEDLPFIKAEKLKEHEKTKFKLPGLDLLKIPTKQERENSNKEEASDPAFLEKILLDFGVSGNIKKVSHGPVVTLNEFEPAAGVKVSKIINLSDDIARNTSSESARIATIPGSNTVGIEFQILLERMFI
jgi:S-DNA-T family DNA segregation ATPase FtsK/SpoIIIE